jgi:hypothetical protein
VISSVDRPLGVETVVVVVNVMRHRPAGPEHGRRTAQASRTAPDTLTEVIPVRPLAACNGWRSAADWLYTCDDLQRAAMDLIGAGTPG